MTSYTLKPLIPPSLLAQQKKAERRKVLEAARQIRQQNRKHRQEQEREAYQTSEEYREYQDMLKAQVTS